MAALPPVGWIRVNSDDPELHVSCRLADTKPDVSGFGGWEVVERPRRKPLTSWKSSPVVTLTLPLLLDRWKSQRSVEREIGWVQQMGTPTGADGRPPLITLDVKGDAVPYHGKTYVVSDISWGDALMNGDGDRCRQFFTLTLIEYVRDKYLTQKSAANRRRIASRKAAQKKGAKKKRVVAKRSSRKKAKAKAGAHLLAAGTPAADDDYGLGESLSEIAANELGDADRWVEIAELNGLRDPEAITPGQVIRLP